MNRNASVDLSELLEYTTHSREPFFAIARKYCREDFKVLDIGAGRGDFARALPACEVFLLDGNAETVKKLREEFSHVFLHKVPNPFPFERGTFDLIHCSHMVEHLYPEQVYTLMKEVDRTLAVGGYFVVSAPLLWRGFYADLSHVRPYPPTVFRSYLCVGGGGSRTRPIVSSDFRVVELRHRYRRERLAYWDISYSRSWARLLLLRITKWLRSMHLSSYSATGYTLVLQKAERPK